MESPSLKKKQSGYGESAQSPKRQKLIGGNADAVSLSGQYEKLQEQRRALPIWTARKRLLKELLTLSSAIMIGETGSGKTTQIPQFLYEAGLNRNHLIACTQPRRVAATSVALRVAAEKGCKLGEVVGYAVRFDDVTSPSTRIKYMTDGILLREAILDPQLKKYSIVILDEAHERTIHTDVLFGVVKAAQKKRRVNNLLPLKIIVMSATMDVDHFSQYFSSAPVLYLEGRQFPVQVMYTLEPQSDYQFTALVTVFQIHQQAPANQDILVFTTGQEEIESMVKSIRDISHDLTGDAPRLIVYPLYSALTQAQQLKAFQPTPPGARKVIVSTNIAETSVTIPGIRFVIDTGMVKEKSFNPNSGLDLLKVQRISKAQAWQRTGRAGRESPGTCYRLYTEAEYEQMANMTIPQIQRCNLASVILQLLAMGIKNILSFDFMDKPNMDAILASLEQLELLGAVETPDGNPVLTQSGRQMAAFPLDPRLAKVILSAKDHHCLEEILTIVALLSVDSIVQNPHNKREQALAARQKFTSPEGDQITNLNIYRAYKGAHGSKEWCMENFVNGRNVATAVDVRRQLREIAISQELPLQSCGRELAPVRRCLVTGFFMNTAELQREGEYVTLSMRKPVTIHPSSSLFMSKPGYVIYNELVQTTKCYMRDLCVVDPEWLYEVAPDYFRKRRHGKIRS